MAVPMRTGTEKGPTNEVGYMGPAPIKWSMWTGDMEENVPDLRWPRSTKVYHQMRTDAQLAGLLLAVFLPIRRSRWVIDPNGARDEVVEQIASDLRLPIRGTEDPPPRARRRVFRHDDHLRHALLALVYGFMFFEQVGTVQPDGTWRLAKLPPRMPQTISKIETDDADDLTAIKQWPRPGDPFDGRPIAAGVLSPYIWEKEGGNWTGRSLLRACYRDWIVKDRLIRVDAVKHERFGIGIPYASAPAGASKETIERYAAMARAIRADPQSGVGLPEKGDIGVEGIRGTLPDTLASIHYHDQAMARSFLAMFLELGQQGTHGNRALGESFVDFFKMAVDAVAGWYADSTQAEVIDDIVTWNYGEDETPPAIDWDEDPESRMDASDLVALIDSGAVVVDNELRTWISDRWGVADPGPNTPTPPGPSTGTASVPASEPGQTTPVAVAASRTQHGSRRPFVHGRHPHFHPRVAAAGGTRRSRTEARSQTLNSPKVGHRDPTKVELAAKTDFAKLQQQWQDQTTALVESYQTVRSQQIDELAQQVQDAVEAGNVDDLASVLADTDGADVITTHMLQMLEDAVVTAKEEAKAQGVDLATIDTSVTSSRLTGVAGAIADLITQSISTSAATQGLQRYGVSSLSAEDVANGVRDHLESLSDSYLNDMLGGALTQAQNAGRMLVMGESPASFYSSELLDENTCDACAAEDGTQFDTIDDAMQDYPTGGFSECLGGPRCRGTVVAVYGEATSE